MKNTEASGLSFMTFIIGLAIGTTWFDIPHVRFDNSFDVSDVTNIFLTSFIAIFYANWVKKKYEDKKNSKQLIISELSELCGKIENLAEKMRAQEGNTLTKEDANEIMDMKFSLSSDFSSIISVIIHNFGGNSNKLVSRLKNKNFYFRQKIDLWEGKTLEIAEFDSFRKNKNSFLSEIRSAKSLINLM